MAAKVKMGRKGKYFYHDQNEEDLSYVITDEQKKKNTRNVFISVE